MPADASIKCTVFATKSTNGASKLLTVSAGCSLLNLKPSWLARNLFLSKENNATLHTRLFPNGFAFSGVMCESTSKGVKITLKGCKMFNNRAFATCGYPVITPEQDNYDNGCRNRTSSRDQDISGSKPCMAMDTKGTPTKGAVNPYHQNKCRYRKLKNFTSEPNNSHCLRPCQCTFSHSSLSALIL